MNPLIDLAPKLIDLWNFYSDIYVGKENKIFDNSLTVLSERHDINKEDLKTILENLDKDKIDEDQKDIMDEFYTIFYEHILNDSEFRNKLIATRLRHYESSLEEIKELLDSIKGLKNHNDKTDYVDMIKSELEYCIDLLEQPHVKTLPTDCWISVNNSGLLTLFNKDTELKSIREIYNKIQDFNERSKIQKFIGYPWERLEYEDGMRLPKMQVKQFLEIRSWLLAELKKYTSS